MSAPTSVVCVGECMAELVHVDDRLLALGFAGDTYNTAVYLKRGSDASLQVSYVTALGTDVYSDLAAATAAGEGLRMVGPRLSDRSIGLYLVRTDDEGERSFTYYRAGSAASTMFANGWTPSYDDEIVSADLVYLSAVSVQILGRDQRRHLVELLVEARGGGARVAFDSNLRLRGWTSLDEAREAIGAVIPHCDIALPSLADERILWGAEDAVQVAARYHDTGSTEVVVKDGSNATHLFTADGHLELVPPTGVRVVDTTGAGDSFNGAYLAARLAGTSPAEAAAAAQRTAAFVIQHRGGIAPRLPVPPCPA